MKMGFTWINWTSLISSGITRLISRRVSEVYSILISSEHLIKCLRSLNSREKRGLNELEHARLIAVEQC